MKTSIIIPSHNEGDMLPWTVERVLENTRGDCEIIIVDDGSDDGSGEAVSAYYAGREDVRVERVEGLGIARAKNLGAALAQGDYLVFLDAHSSTPLGWLPALLEPFSEPKVALVGPGLSPVKEATLDLDDSVRGLGMQWRDASLDAGWMAVPDLTQPYPAMMLCGCCVAVRREAFDALGRFDIGLTRWGQEDEAICVQAWLQGYTVLVHPGVTVYHMFRSKFPYPVDYENVLFNKLRLAILYLDRDRMNRVLDHYKGQECFSRVMVRILESNTFVERVELQPTFVRTAAWLFERFGVDI